VIVFLFYITAILVLFTLAAAIADFSLWLQERRHPEWEEDE
jgi:hypothetical protein